jgi:hypothetical protein
MVSWLDGVPSNSKSWTSLKRVVGIVRRYFIEQIWSCDLGREEIASYAWASFGRSGLGKEDQGVCSIIAAWSGPDEQDKAKF